MTSYELAKIILNPLGISLDNLKSAVIFLEAGSLPMVHCKYEFIKEVDGEVVSEVIMKKFKVHEIDEEES